MLVEDATTVAAPSVGDNNFSVTTATAVNDQSSHEELDPSQRWRAIEKLVSRPSPFGAETGQLAVGQFEPFEDVSNILDRSMGGYDDSRLVCEQVDRVDRQPLCP